MWSHSNLQGDTVTQDSAAPRFEKLESTLKERILDAAVGEFFRFGYGSASMNRLVETAGISKGAIFKYFGTKAGLFKYVYRVALDDVKDSLRQVREATSGQPFFERLSEVIKAGLDLSTRRPMYASVYYRVIYTGDAPHGKDILGEIQATSQRFLASLIQDGIDNGDLRSDIEPHRAAFILQSVLDRFLQAHHLEFMTPLFESRTGDISDADQWIDEIITIFRKGMENNAG